jgi:hypothetical protein
MNKILLTLLFVTSTVQLFGQKKEKDTAKVILPTKDGLVYYESVIDSIGSKSKESLYNASLKWMAESFVDSKEVIQIKDPVAGSIVGSGRFDYTPKGFMSTSQRMSFMVEITVKDNKSRIRLYKFKNKILGSSGYGLVAASGDSDYISIDKGYQTYLSNKRFPKENRSYFQAIDERIQGIIKSYKEFLSSNSNDDNF